MLVNPSVREQPFSHIYLDQAFSVEHCELFETLFTVDGDWQHRDGSFYQCSILDVTQRIPEIVQQEILSRIRAITNLPLVEHMLITAQHMQPGQAIGIHSDRPLLGYELLRLVVQFNKNWQIDHGGVLELFQSQNGEATEFINPEYNIGFIFELNEKSYHGVTEANQPRKSMVFNFWHAANTPELENYIKTFFSNTHFSELPSALDPVAASVESELSEQTTLVAETASVALKRWGYNDETVVKGYQYSVGLIDGLEPDEETYCALRLANWVASLHRLSFDFDNWRKLYRDLASKKIPARLEKAWQLCLPVID